MSAVIDTHNEPADRVPLSARLMRGWNVEWRTPHASGRTTTIARTFSEACRHVGDRVEQYSSAKHGQCLRLAGYAND